MSYKSDLQGNNAELEEILRIANELPEAGSGTGALVITATAGVDELTNVSHTFAQMYEAHQSGQPLVLQITLSGGSIEILQCAYVSDSNIIFNALSTVTGENIVYSANIFDDDTNVYLSNEVGGVDEETLDTAIDEALTEAKASGEFDGADGVSPTVAVATITGGHRITITDKNGTKTVDVMDGATGATGATGAAGRGIKSIARTSGSGAAGTTDTYTITYTDNTTSTFAVYNGKNGTNGTNGTNGKDGTSVTVSKVTESTASGGTNVVTFSDGTTLNVKNGKDGKDGAAAAFDPSGYDIPVLNLTGDISPIAVSKDNKVTLTYVYGDRSGTCTLKGQGSSSYKKAQEYIKAGKAGKFNYTITFDNAFEAKSGWGSQKKYCLKANFIDHSHSRNVVSCKLWGMSVKARKTVPTELANLPNGGAIDGFPIVIMVNGEFHGLYTFNIPKDGWMFGLVEDSSKQQALVGANDHELATQFKGLLAGDESDFELEFVSDENNAGWVTTSLNRLIQACIDSRGGDLDDVVGQYIDWDSAIDYFIHCVVDKGSDAVDKNFLLTTFDGVKWYFTNYDRDTICGLAWDGSALDRPVSNVSFAECAEASRMWELIYRFKTNALKARYKELRSNILSESRINQIYENFAWAIPSPIAMEDVKKYPIIPGSSVNGIDQICRWMKQRLETVDKWVDALPAQETPVEPDKPEEIVNLVPTSTDTDGTIYNGTGYKDGYRLSSSGSVSSNPEPNATHTGFIKVKQGDVIRIKILGGFAQSGGGNYICFYNGSFGLIKADYPENWVNGTYGTTETLSDGSVLITGFTANQDSVTTATEYFRVSLNPARGANLIVTVNQEIT